MTLRPILRPAILAAGVALALIPAAAPLPALADEVSRNWDRVTFDEVAFDSNGTRLAGALYAPVGAPRAALVLVHDAENDRRLSDFARLFATEGFAVLTYDKRGAGDSAGALPEARRLSPANLDVLAQDAAAAMAFLSSRPALSGLPAGFWGVGAAGWVAPQAAVAAPQTDFLVMWSGAALVLSDALEDALERGDHDAEAEEVAALIAQMRTAGPDPAPAVALNQFARPSLWIFGGQDATLPVSLSVEALERLIHAGHPEITIALNPEGGHALDFHHDRSLLDAMIAWMLRQTDAG